MTRTCTAWRLPDVSSTLECTVAEEHGAHAVLLEYIVCESKVQYKCTLLASRWMFVLVLGGPGI